MWINLKFLKLYQYLKLFKKTTFQSRKRSKGPLKATATTTLLEKQNDNLIIKAQQKALLQKLLKQRLGWWMASKQVLRRQRKGLVGFVEENLGGQKLERIKTKTLE